VQIQPHQKQFKKYATLGQARIFERNDLQNFKRKKKTDLQYLHLQSPRSFPHHTKKWHMSTTIYGFLSFLLFHIRTAQHLDIIKVYYPPTDAPVSCLKNNIKIYIKIDIKTGAVLM
jgi:hypothetical protein